MLWADGCPVATLTFAPLAARALTMPRPIPSEPPVTNAFLPAMFMMSTSAAGEDVGDVVSGEGGLESDDCRQGRVVKRTGYEAADEGQN